MTQTVCRPPPQSRDAAQTTLTLVRRQQQAGYAGYLQVLNAEQAYQLAVLSQVQAEANRYADTVGAVSGARRGLVEP